jgi:hypothetical protein
MTELWQLQAVEPITLSLDDIHRLAARVERGVAYRNRIGLMVSAVEVFVFAGMWMAFPDPLQRFGCVWTVAGLLFMSAQLFLRPAVKPSGNLGLAACLDFQRAELVRQRDFHRGWWFWSRFVAFVPGPFIFGLGALRVFPGQTVFIAAIAVVYVAIAVWAIPLNLRVARGYQRQLDALSAAAA